MRTTRKPIAAILLMAAAFTTPGQAHRQAGATPQDLALQQQVRELACLKPEARVDRLLVIDGAIGKAPTYAHAGLHVSLLQEAQELLAAYHPFLAARSIAGLRDLLAHAEAFVLPRQVSELRDLLDVVTAARSGPQALPTLCTTLDCREPVLAAAIGSVTDGADDAGTSSTSLVAKVNRDYLAAAANRRSAHLLDQIVAQAAAGLPRREAADLVAHVVMLLRLQGDASGDAALAVLSTGTEFLESRGIAGAAAAAFNEDGGLGLVAKVARVLDGTLSLDDAQFPPQFAYSPCRRLMARQADR
ncbi:MAG TPA: hypothetical protein VM847_18745 [Tahibacter sp.]|nr:hypothetical protein [Tahibacter sp.]